MKRLDWMVVPKPIFDRSKNAVGYYLSFQIGNALTGQVRELSHGSDTYLPFFDFINETTLQTLTSGNILFVPATNALLSIDLKNLCHEDSSLIGLMLGKRIELNERNLMLVQKHKEAGFKISFFNVDAEQLGRFLDYTDYIFANIDDKNARKYADISRKYGLKIVALNVDENSRFNMLMANSISLFEGKFYKLPSKSGNSSVSPLQVNYFQLLNDLNKDEFDVEAFSKVISRDTWLAFNFLKMVNSAKQWQTTIKSLKQAAMLVGHKEIKRWITTSVATGLSQDKPSELTKVSLVRAKFCEGIAGLFEMGGHSDSLFLMGLFSVLDVVLDMPMDKALGLIALPDKVKDALNGTDNDFRKVLDFVLMYEHCEWTEISRIALIREIQVGSLFTAYHNALLWYGNLTNQQVEEYVEE